MNKKYLFVYGLAIVLLSSCVSPLSAQIQRIGIEYSSNIRPNSTNTGNYFTVSIPSNSIYLKTDFKLFKESFSAFIGYETTQYRVYTHGITNFRGNRSSQYFNSFGLVKENEFYRNNLFIVNGQFGFKILQPGVAAAGFGIRRVITQVNNTSTGSYEDISGKDRTAYDNIPMIVSRISLERDILWDKFNLELFLQYDYGFNNSIMDVLVTTGSGVGDLSVLMNSDLIPETISTQRMLIKANAIHYGLNIKWVFR